MERAPKRRKAAKACDNCRRQKSRCEWDSISDESPHRGCHRCRVLSQVCTIDGQPLAQDIHRVPSPGPGPPNSIIPGTPKQANTSPSAGVTEQERGVQSYQPSFHESLHSLENSESFFTDLEKTAWTTPMAMLTRLMARHTGRPFTSDTGKDPASNGILSEQEVRELLSIFKQRYEPWLGIEAPTPMSPFLVSVRCLIAARHLPDYRRLMVIPPLHILCREHAMSFVLSSTPNLASIQALHILSTWEPIESLTSAGHRLEVQDGGALIAAAIAHASALKLDVAAEFVHSCSESKDVPEHVAFKAKMWLTLCASEFAHCIGVGRFRLSSFQQITASILDGIDLSTPASARQVRLNFLAHMITRIEEGFRTMLKSTENTVLNPVFTLLDSWLVRFSHLHLITDVEKPCFHALLIQYHGYRFLLLTHAVLQIFVSPDLDAITRLNRLRESTWGRQLIMSAKTILIEFVRFGEQPYASSLSHTPDHLLNLVCFATLLLIKTRHSHGAAQPYPLSTLPPLVERVTGFFKKLALTEDHLPMRCAMLIETLMNASERIRARPSGCLSLADSGETGRPPMNDDREWEQPGSSSRPPVSTPTSLSASAAVNTESRTSMAGKGYTEANVPVPNPTHSFGFDGLTNLDQTGGIEMFFNQSIWPEGVLSGPVRESDGRGVLPFDLRDFFGLYDTQPQF